MNSSQQLREILRFLQSRQREMERLLKRFVLCESPTDDQDAVNRFGRIVGAEWRRRGAKVEYLPNQNTGNHVRIVWPQHAARAHDARGRSGQILVLGHLDTVYDVGTIQAMPFRISRGRAFGPGIFDMKAGIVIALWAADALARVRWLPQRRVTLLWTSDEETGSESSRQVIEREARQSAAVLVLEPANGRSGQLKTRRKATGTAELVITGRAAHAGLNPQSGINAIHELALQAERLIGWNDPRRGITVSPTLAHAGTRSNVIPAEARLTLDLRAETIADMRRIEHKLKAMRPILPGSRIAIRGGFSRPPLERHASSALFSKAQKLGECFGLSLGECLAGGGSDGNFTAALSVPTLDGLGAVGDGAHSADEHIILSALPERAALLAGLLATL